MLHIIRSQPTSPFHKSPAYHHLLHDFLRQQSVSQPEEVRERHRRAAGFFQSVGDDEEAIYHWLAAEEFPAEEAKMA